jgi:hypothetical protein
MKKSAELAVLAALTLLISPHRVLGQDKEPDHGTVDFGVRFATGDEYGRPDLPFQPPVKTSQFNGIRMCATILRPPPGREVRQRAAY